MFSCISFVVCDMDAAAALVELDILIQFSAGYKGGFPNFDVLRKVLVANGSSDFDQMAQSFSIIVTLVCNIKEICHGVVDRRSIAAMDASIKVMQVACMRFGEISIADHIAPLTGAICHTFMKVVHYEIIERGISATIKDGDVVTAEIDSLVGQLAIVPWMENYARGDRFYVESLAACKNKTLGVVTKFVRSQKGANVTEASGNGLRFLKRIKAFKGDAIQVKKDHLFRHVHGIIADVVSSGKAIVAIREFSDCYPHIFGFPAVVEK